MKDSYTCKQQLQFIKEAKRLLLKVGWTKEEIARDKNGNALPRAFVFSVL